VGRLGRRHNIKTAVLERQLGGIGDQENGVASFIRRPLSEFNLIAIDVDANDVQPIGVRHSTGRLTIAAADVQKHPPGFDGQVTKPSNGLFGHVPAVTCAVDESSFEAAHLHAISTRDSSTSAFRGGSDSAQNV
jgi:hypothetical protein